MIAIDNILISDEIVQEQFVCDLNKCKGGCCVDGDAGAPLNIEELQKLNEVYDAVLPYLPEESKTELKLQGKYVNNKEFGWVTPTIESKVCVYGVTDKNGIVKCGIEQAYNDGKIKWKKPISCHLFPIRIQQSKDKQTEYVNYEPREDLCSAACTLGKKLKVPVYVFLKDALVRNYGTEFYETLEATAQHLNTKP
ncbi:DUF3109 family protein [Ferruginibacter sp.]|uniref:DUF3109 family protein n=1 Tax=Ferruginibacter sp. TaxID=1940288 RepID=UPI00199DA14D|nr:DUF3109 family protein [Ferruginibacter sp.]MBC7627944.1 DUF3109 family protein [Ferruginibacter sp.]